MPENNQQQAGQVPGQDQAGASAPASEPTLKVRVEPGNDETRLRWLRRGIVGPVVVEVGVSCPGLDGATEDGTAYLSRYSLDTYFTYDSPLSVARDAIAEGQDVERAIRAYDADIRAKMEDRRIEQEAAARERAEEEERTRPAREAEGREREAIRARMEAEAKAKAEAKEADREAWIEAHGSEGLRERVARGYDCTRRYLTERATSEMPKWTLYQWDDQPKWYLKDRTCPSDKALLLEDEAKAKGHEARTYWAEWNDYEPDEETGERDEAPEPCEVVVIMDYHGHELYRIP